MGRLERTIRGREQINTYWLARLLFCDASERRLHGKQVRRVPRHAASASETWLLSHVKRDCPKKNPTARPQPPQNAGEPPAPKKSHGATHQHLCLRLARKNQKFLRNFPAGVMDPVACPAYCTISACTHSSWPTVGTQDPQDPSCASLHTACCPPLAPGGLGSFRRMRLLRDERGGGRNPLPFRIPQHRASWPSCCTFNARRSETGWQHFIFSRHV